MQHCAHEQQNRMHAHVVVSREGISRRARLHAALCGIVCTNNIFTHMRRVADTWRASVVFTYAAHTRTGVERILARFTFRQQSESK